jgi:hypothetical protein
MATTADEALAAEETVPTLDEALAAAETALPGARPFKYRIECAANSTTGAVIEAYGAVLGSKSEAIRHLLMRGARDLKREWDSRA